MNNTKLTAHQNQQITETLCRMAAAKGWRYSKDADADSLMAARRALVQGCEELNLTSSRSALETLNMSA